jgi:hypothetical protein
MPIEDVTARDVDAFASALVSRKFNGQAINPADSDQATATALQRRHRGLLA